MKTKNYTQIAPKNPPKESWWTKKDFKREAEQAAARMRNTSLRVGGEDRYIGQYFTRG